MPSAIVPRPVFPACTPTMRTPGRSARSAIAIPAASPPPPTGRRNVPTSGSSSASSRPIVPCPAITVLVLERVHERRARLARRAPAPSTSASSKPAPASTVFGAVVARRVDLRHRRVLRHEDRRADPELARRPGDRLAVVARARRDHAGGALLVAERRELVDRAAHLERAGALQVLGLQPRRGGRRAARATRSRRPASTRAWPAMRSRAAWMSASVGLVVRRQCGTPSRGSHEPPSAGRAGAPARRRGDAAARHRPRTACSR